MAALPPLAEAGKLACMLAQFPYSFHPTPEGWAYLRLPRGLGDVPAVMGLRHAIGSRRPPSRCCGRWGSASAAWTSRGCAVCCRPWPWLLARWRMCVSMAATPASGQPQTGLGALQLHLSGGRAEDGRRRYGHSTGGHAHVSLLQQSLRRPGSERGHCDLSQLLLFPE